MSNQALQLFQLQNKAQACSYPGCKEPGQSHTSPALCHRHEIIARIVGMRTRPAWGGQFRLIMAEDVNVALRRIQPDAPHVLQAELDHFIDAFRQAREGR